MAKLLQSIWNNKKQRKILILVILIFILISLIIYRILNMEAPAPEGSLRVVICRNCKHKYVQRIKDITDKTDERNSCEKCQGKLAISWKCDDCQFEYPEILMKVGNKDMSRTMEKYKAVVEARRCPNCGSLSTHPISVNELKGK